MPYITRGNVMGRGDGQGTGQEEGGLDRAVSERVRCGTEEYGTEKISSGKMRGWDRKTGNTGDKS